MKITPADHPLSCRFALHKPLLLEINGRGPRELAPGSYTGTIHLEVVSWKPEADSAYAAPAFCRVTIERPDAPVLRWSTFIALAHVANVVIEDSWSGEWGVPDAISVSREMDERFFLWDDAPAEVVESFRSRCLATAVAAGDDETFVEIELGPRVYLIRGDCWPIVDLALNAAGTEFFIRYTNLQAFGSKPRKQMMEEEARGIDGEETWGNDVDDMPAFFCRRPVEFLLPFLRSSITGVTAEDVFDRDDGERTPLIFEEQPPAV